MLHGAGPWPDPGAGGRPGEQGGGCGGAGARRRPHPPHGHPGPVRGQRAGRVCGLVGPDQSALQGGGQPAQYCEFLLRVPN